MACLASTHPAVGQFTHPRSPERQESHNTKANSHVLDVSSGWHSIAAVGIGGQTKYYIDGAHIQLINYQSSTDVKYIGANVRERGQFAEAIDDMRIHSRALSDAEIADLHAL